MTSIAISMWEGQEHQHGRTWTPMRNEHHQCDKARIPMCDKQ
jgi:hypothetical protein